MTSSRLAVVAGVGLALVASACGSSATKKSTTAPAGTVAAAPTVQTASVPGVGTVLVDGAGRTLYLFSPDRQATVTCTGACAAVWPPLTPAGRPPQAGSGVDASLLGTVQGTGGAVVVTYNRWPLYTFAHDSGPGQARGQGIHSFGGSWSAVTAAGKPVSVPAAPGGPATTASSGYAGY